jgi:protein disulfide-isomerase
MKKFLSILSIIVTTTFFAANAQEVRNGLTWYDDIQKANEESLKTKRPIFAFFTGSDWCGWCHRLQANVFNKNGFMTWAKKNVVLLELDFPRNKKLPDNIVEQNSGLQQFFQVGGYPTIWIFNMEKDAKTGKFNITPFGSLSYPQAERGKEEEQFLKDANAVLKNGEKAATKKKKK